jgi:arsenite methyltransferase
LISWLDISPWWYNKSVGVMKMEKEEIKKSVREGYARIAKQDRPCCTSAKSCCGSTSLAEDISKNVGYTEEELKAIPEGANLGLGCGNPVALASLREGETVLDLGSGAGLDCFLAAGKVGEKGRVIGVDMTPEMIEKARENASKGNYGNVEFRLGEVENLPVADSSVDAVISNCVINLVPDKGKVFREIFRVLRPGGRLMVSDIVVLTELPESIRNSIAAYVGCLSGAIMKDEYLGAIAAAGFGEVRVVDEVCYPVDSIAGGSAAIVKDSSIPRERLAEYTSSVLSIRVYAIRPD